MRYFKSASKCILILMAVISLCCEVQAGTDSSSGRVLESFNKLTGWEVIEGPGAKLELFIEKGLEKNCLRLDYSLGSTDSYVVTVKDCPLSLSQRYKFVFYVKGVSQKNNLEFKLIDKKGNTFWKKWENFEFSENWEKVVVRERDIAYAWGPEHDAKLREVQKIEFAISGTTSAKERVYIDDLTLFSLSDVDSAAVMKVKASSVENGQYRPEKAIDRNVNTRWSSKFSDPQWFELDLGEVREVTGVILNWVVYGNYDVLLSEDGKDWVTVYTNNDADGGIDDIYFKKAKARFIKILGKKRKTEFGYSLSEIAIKGPDEEILLAASSSQKSNGVENALDGSVETKWHSKAGDDQWLEIDFRDMKRFGGLFLVWDKDYAVSYEIVSSNKGEKWETIYSTTDGKGGKEKIYLKQTGAQFVRILCKKSATKKGFGIKEIEIKAPEESASLQKYYEIAAQESPLGYYPRWLTKEQTYWTYVGIEGDENEALISEDGIIEPHKRGFTIEPFLYLDSKLITRENAGVSQSLEKDYLPIPSVKWEYKDVIMNLKLFASGKTGESIAYGWYTVKNNREETVSGKLFLTIRPFQVYTPWQGFRDGGLSPIYSIKYKNCIIDINGKYEIYALTKPDNFGVRDGSFEIPHGSPEGDIINSVKKGVIPTSKSAENVNGDVSGAIEYEFKLKPGASKNYFVAIPLHNNKPSLKVNTSEEKLKAKFKKILEERIAFWESKVNRIEIDIPELELVNTLKSNIAYNLITMDGPGFQPGSRCYDKPWIRDGGMAAAALLRMGLTSEIREFIDWFSTYQYEDGKVPPIIDTKAEDPLWEEKEKGLIEYDSQGEFVYTILQYYWFTKDKEFLKGKLDNVIKALEYLVYLRSQTLTSEFKNGPAEKRKYYGILPPSQSHEGYWREYSYWDDFWGLKGWKDGRTIFAILGRDDLVDWADKEYADFKKCFYDSARLTMEFYNIDYFPASASLGDCDPTSTAVAVMYCDELENLPKKELKFTFDKYYKDLSSRFKPNAEYRFTPYEIRSVPAFLYMGQKKKALNLLRFMVSCRRPLNWNHLAEVVHSDYRFPTYLGDMPHTWVGAEYINGFRSLFVYETENRLVLGHGIDEKWLLSERGVSVGNLPTYYGKINYTIKKENNVLKIKVWGDAVSPPDGFVFKLPWPEKIKQISLNGRKYEGFSGKEIVFCKLPVEIVIQMRTQPDER